MQWPDSFAAGAVLVLEILAHYRRRHRRFQTIASIATGRKPQSTFPLIGKRFRSTFSLECDVRMEAIPTEVSLYEGIEFARSI